MLVDFEVLVKYMSFFKLLKWLELCSFFPWRFVNELYFLYFLYIFTFSWLILRQFLKKDVISTGSSIDGPSANDNQTYRLRGSSQPEKCLKVLKQMISTNCTNNKPCGLNDILQPEVHGKFMVRQFFTGECNRSWP